MKTTISGIEKILSSPEKFGIIPGKTAVGLLTNSGAGLKDGGIPIDALLRKDIRIVKLFSPEHGIHGIYQDMIPVDERSDRYHGIEVISLYGSGKESLEPSPIQLKDIDLFLIDLQDIGCRYYTFIWTMSYCMEACKKANIPVLVADRVNPLGGEKLDGNIQEEGFLSFVGRFPILIVHGMTIGEIAVYLKENHDIDCDLNVATLSNWSRRTTFEKTGLFWIPTSPNMPSIRTARVYPGICLFEGTNISEGRGTTTPFEFSGAPWIDCDEVLKYLGGDRVEGALLRPVRFLPTFHKYRGNICNGFHIIIHDWKTFSPFRTGLKLIEAYLNLYPERFSWRREPYEFESERLAFDLLTGTDSIRKRLAKGEKVEEMEDELRNAEDNFSKKRKEFLLYE